MSFEQPFFSNRKWIKVWISEWLEGTLRWQATPEQRALWIDLLTLAGKSRYPGIVCAGRDGENGEHLVGYPAVWIAPSWPGVTDEQMKTALDFFSSKGMLSYEVSTGVTKQPLYAVMITKWKQYQSDYEANKKYQKKYREKRRSSSPSKPCLTSPLDERKTLDLDLEVESKKATDSVAAQEQNQEPSRQDWKVFRIRYYELVKRRVPDTNQNRQKWHELCEANGISKVLAAMESYCEANSAFLRTQSNGAFHFFKNADEYLETLAVSEKEEPTLPIYKRGDFLR